MLSNSPVARNTDPITSHIAAEQIKPTRAVQQQRVLKAVKDHPGMTSAEIANLLQTDRFMPARRLPELCPAYVRKGLPRTCNVTGKLCLTWWAVCP